MQWLLVAVLCTATCTQMAGAADSHAGSADVLAAFLHWCEISNIYISPDVALQPSARHGLGLFAEGNLVPKEDILRIPMRAMINIEHAIISPTFGPVFLAIEDDPDVREIEVMAAFLAHEMHKGNSSWAPYFAIFPTELAVPPLLEDNIREVATNDGAPEEVVTLLVDRLQQLQKAFSAFKRTLGPDGSWLTWDTFNRAHALLRSRSHLVSVKDEMGQWHRAMCLVPLADAFNTDLGDGVNVVCKTDGELYGPDSVLVCRATKLVRAGQELLVHYVADKSRRTPTRLYVDYGIRLPKAV
eukprot:m.237813 g.237813  ORF g.237813 m.237813 type:complete len:299 (+) comp13202_c0_seq1:48-944(+)